MGTFIDRNPDGTVKGMYFCRQHEGQEEVANGHADLVAFQQKCEDVPRLAKQQLADQIDAANTVDELKAIVRKLVS